MSATEIPAPPEDHRTRVGAQRRERTRLQLLTSAIDIFNDKGPDATVIDDLIAAAGVSRGTFYNHFKTTSELLTELASRMSDEVLAVVDPMVLQREDHVERFAVGMRLYMRTALRYPQWGRFMTQVGTRVAARGQLIDQYVTRDLRAAREHKRLNVPDVDVARDLALGAIFYGIETMLSEPTRRNYAESLIRHVLIGLGLDAAEASRIVTMPLKMPARVQGPIFDSLE
ncbi:MAG: TetR/AcrR family transcriptional regulator [Burkholderiaceae bacterium]